MADEKKAPEEAGAQKKPGLLENKVIVLGGVVGLQVVLAVVLTMVVIVPRLGTSSAAVAEAETGAIVDDQLGQLLSLGEIIVTLQTEGAATRYLRINVDLELRDVAAVETATARLPILRDTVIMTLSNRTAEDLNRPEGMKGLRDELMRRLDERLPGEILRHIYFSDLVIQ